MTPPRFVAALATILTVLLLQATVVGPVAIPLAVSLPAIVVAAVALSDGPSTGMAFGFVTGLAADLGSHHPAGLLALCWLGVGLICGRVPGPRRTSRDAVVIGVVAGLASGVAGVLLALTGGGADAAGAWASSWQVLPVGAIDAALALVVAPFVRWTLRSARLRLPNPVYTELGRPLATQGRRG